MHMLTKGNVRALGAALTIASLSLGTACMHAGVASSDSAEVTATSSKVWQSAAEPATVLGTLEKDPALPAEEYAIELNAARDSAQITIDGKAESLAWNGQSPEACACRFFRNERYAVMVRDKSLTAAPSATIMQLVGDDQEIVHGVLKDKDGMAIKVALAVAADGKTVSFNSGGEEHVLMLNDRISKVCGFCRTYADSTYTADVVLPDDLQSGKADIEAIQ